MNKMAIDTSSNSIAVAIEKDGVVLSDEFFFGNVRASEKLFDLIITALDKAGLKIKDIDNYTYTSGPGSFTGLRIASTTVKGFCQPYDTPITEVSTLKALAYHFKDSKDIICPVLDAQRNEVYVAIYDFSADEPLCVEDMACENIKVMEMLNEKFPDRHIIFTGDGSGKFNEFVSDRFEISEHKYILGSDILKASSDMDANSNYMDTDITYIRNVDAKINYKVEI